MTANFKLNEVRWLILIDKFLLNGFWATGIKMESTRKLSNFNFQWTKTLYQNILDYIAFFFTLFKGLTCN